MDNRLCTRNSKHCFRKAEAAAEYLGALSATDNLRFPYPLKQAYGGHINPNIVLKKKKRQKD